MVKCLKIRQDMLFMIVFMVLCIEYSHMSRDESFIKLSGTNAIATQFVYLEFNLIRSSMECATICLDNSACWSFGYHSIDSKCQVISSVLTETIVAGGDLGWIYFVKAEHCLSPWRLYRSSCYYIKQDTVNFNDAQNQCTNLQSHLVKIDDEGENSFAETLVKEEGVRHHWIGLSDDLQEGTWLWHPSLEGPTYTDWSGPQPDGGTGENCAVIYSDGNMWHDYSCYGQFSFICEREL